MRLILSTTAIAGLIAGAATADGVSYGQLSFDRQNFDADGDDVTVSEFFADIEYEYGQFLLGGAINNVDADFGDLGTAEARVISAFGGYFINPEVLLGLGISSTDNGGDDSSAVNAFGQYKSSQIGAALGITQDTDADTTQYLAIGTYAVTPAIELGGAFATVSDVDGVGYVLSGDYDEGPIDGRLYYEGQTEFDGTTFGARGSYEFGGSFRGLAGFETQSFPDPDDSATSFNVGAGYKITDGAWIDARVGQISVEDDDADIDITTFSIGLSFETGERTRIDGAFGDDRRRDFQNGLRQRGNVSSETETP